MQAKSVDDRLSELARAAATGRAPWQGRPAASLTDLEAFVSGLVRNKALALLARAHGLEWFDVSWQDTGRTAHSCWGPGIADFTLALGQQPGRVPRALRLPFLQTSNCVDLTSDWRASSLMLRVGNEAPTWNGDAAALSTVSLLQFLAAPGAYLPACGALPSVPAQPVSSLCRHADSRDEDVLVATQVCVLPCPTESFHVACAPYGRRTLVLVSTPQGTSAHLVDGYAPTQLLFNHAGKAAPWRAELLKVERARTGKDVHAPMDPDERARNAIVIVQIPLAVPARPPLRCWTYGSSTYWAGKKGVDSGADGPDNTGLATNSDDSNEAYGVPESGSVSMSWDPFTDTVGPPPAPAAASCASCASSAFDPEPVYRSGSASPAQDAQRRPLAAAAAAAPLPPAVSVQPPAPDLTGFGFVMVSTAAPTSVPFTGGFSNTTAPLVRDPKLPVRVTLQFYAGTGSLSAEDISASHMQQLADMTNGPRREAAARGLGHGSLVVDPEAARAARTTAPVLPVPVPAALSDTAGWPAMPWDARPSSVP